MSEGHGWYPGDGAFTDSGTLGIIERIDGQRVRLRVANGDGIWLDVRSLARWTGDCLTVLPRTRRGWRKRYLQLTEMGGRGR